MFLIKHKSNVLVGNLINLFGKIKEIIYQTFEFNNGRYEIAAFDGHIFKHFLVGNSS